MTEKHKSINMNNNYNHANCRKSNMDYNDPIPGLVKLISIFFVVVVTWIFVDARQTKVNVFAKVNELAHSADSKSETTEFSASEVVKDHCVDIAYQLKAEGYDLRTSKKIILTNIDMIHACRNNEKIEVRSN